MNQPDIQITHGLKGSPACHDGFAAYWIVQGKWPGTPCVFASYDDPPPDVTGLGVLITDFSYPEAVLREMAAKAKWIHVLDHHKSAHDTLLKLRTEGLINVTFDTGRSGAGLTWDYCWGAGRALPWLVQYVQDRDLWLFEMADTRAAHALLASHPLTMEAWREVAKRLEDPAKRGAAIAEGGAILRAEKRTLDAILAATARIEVIGDHEVPVANVPYMFASDAGHILAQGHPFAGTYFDRADGTRQWSLRSAPDGMDVSKIAEAYGGGGHKHAAGFIQVLMPSDEPEPEVVGS